MSVQALSNRWHHALAQITGGLVLRMVKHALSKSELKEHAKVLRQVADEMERFAAGEEINETGFMLPRRPKL